MAGSVVTAEVTEEVTSARLRVKALVGLALLPRR